MKNHKHVPSATPTQSTSIRSLILLSALAALLVIVGMNALALKEQDTQELVQRISLIKNPGNYGYHTLLARDLWQQGESELAAKELLLSYYGTTRLRDSRKSSVLGVTTDTPDFRAWKNEKNFIQNEFRYWQQIAQQNPGYTDAYVMMALTANSLGDNGKALEIAEKALGSDPIHANAIRLMNVLSGRK